MTSTTLYNCVVCQQPNISLLDLHYHHMQYHTSEELSLTIISLQGFQLLKKSISMETDFSEFKVNEKSNDDNNNECLHEVLTIKGEMNDDFPSNTIFISQTDNEIEKKPTHDTADCLIKCSPFIAWENQLNKREEISHDDFINITNHLCNDLAKRKCRDKNRKGKSTKDNRNIIQANKTKKLIVTNNKKFDNFTFQVSASTSSLCDKKNLVSELDLKSNDEHFNLQLRDSNDTISLASNKIDATKNRITYDPVTNIFSWSSHIILNSDIKEISVKAEDANSCI